MKWDVRIEENGQQPYSDVETLLDHESGMQSYAYCLPRYAKLDGNYQNAPEMIEKGTNGFISECLSDENGTFSDPPVITVSYDRLKSSNGFGLVFNRLSGDFADWVKIVWLKDDTVVWEQEFYPDRTDYFCEAKVPLFNRVIITFLRTNRPYRYLWLASLKSQRMMDAGGLKIVYEDIALGASADSQAESTDKEYYVELQNLKEGVEFPNHALCLPRYAKMNGTYANVSDELGDMGYVSDSISDESGSFEVPPEISFSFGQNYSSVGITLRFNDYSGDYCKNVNIRWYRDEELLADQNYTPDAAEYFCYGVVDYYNKVIIRFLETSKPYRNVFLTKITWGLVRVFKDDEIEDASCLMELNPISSEVSINTLNYAIRSKTDYAFEFQKQQRQTLYFDETILGVFYLQEGKQLGAKRYHIETQDVVGILDSSLFMGGIYEEVLASDLLNEIMQGEDKEYFLDDAFAKTVVSGYLPITTKRNALQQLAFAIGALVDTGYDRQLYLYPQQAEITGAFTKKEIRLGLEVSHSEIVTGVRLYVHSYGRDTEEAELYRGVLSGTTMVEFSEPYHSLFISGGTLGEYGANYAYITGIGDEVVLSGMRYSHNMITVTKEDERITQNKNIAEIKEATLVTSGNADEVLNRVYDYYRNNESVSFRASIADQELGDRVSVDTGYRGKTTGMITKLDFKFSRKKITAEVTVE